MGGGGYSCSPDENNRFSAPVPWIGIYIAGASLICLWGIGDDTTNGILNNQYDCKAPTRLQSAQMEHIKSDVGKVWLMAHTSSPQYVMARSAMSGAAGALTCVSVVLLLQAEIRSFFTHFCQGHSDYQWANWPVVVSQTVAVLVGSIAPALRWFNATGNRKSGGFGYCREEFGVEKFWVQRLEEWKDDPLPEYCWFLNRSVRKRLHLFRNAVLDICISFQTIALRVSKTVRLASALLAFLFRTMLYHSCTKGERASNDFGSSRDLRLLDWRIQVGSVSDSISSQGTTAGVIGFNNYVLHLEGEDDLVLWMSSSGRKDMDRWMETGGRKIVEHCYSCCLSQVCAKDSWQCACLRMKIFPPFLLHPQTPLPTVGLYLP